MEEITIIWQQGLLNAELLYYNDLFTHKDINTFMNFPLSRTFLSRHGTEVNRAWDSLKVGHTL